MLASDGTTNLKGRTKAEFLVKRFGRGNFDYIGDSRSDIPCWEHAATALTAGVQKTRRVPDLQTLDMVERPLIERARVILRALRPHQWVKNLLLLVPPMAAHRWDGPAWTALAVALVSISLCASGGYVLNDILDVDADRHHPRKKRRPFAAGSLSIRSGVVLLGLCWLAGFGLAIAFLPAAFASTVAVYLVATTAYSLAIKREPVLDVMFLAGLYVLRVIAGGAATAVHVSTWLLAFTLFVCLSLALLKRYIEVRSRADAGTGSQLHSRRRLMAALCGPVVGVPVDAGPGHLFQQRGRHAPLPPRGSSAPALPRPVVLGHACLAAGAPSSVARRPRGCRCARSLDIRHRRAVGGDCLHCNLNHDARLRGATRMIAHGSPA